MAKKIFITKSNGQLIPFDNESKSTIDRWKDGKTYALTYKEARNAEYHRLIFGIAQMYVDNVSDDSPWHGKTAKAFIKAVEVACGMVEIYPDITGKNARVEAQSIAFENMDQKEFEQIYRPMMDKITKDLDCTEHDILTNMGDA